MAGVLALGFTPRARSETALFCSGRGEPSIPRHQREVPETIKRGRLTTISSRISSKLAPAVAGHADIISIRPDSRTCLWAGALTLGTILSMDDGISFLQIQYLAVAEALRSLERVVGCHELVGAFGSHGRFLVKGRC